MGATTARGRVARVVATSGAWTGLRSERQHVVAWLLRSHRLLAADRRLRQVGPFVAAFPGGSWHRPIDATRISKWETTSAAPDAPAVRRYEELLDLPRGQLVACMDVLLRYSATRIRAAPGLARPDLGLDPATHGRLADTVMAAHEDAEVDGAAWDELTHFLAVTPAAVLLRPDSPSVLAWRLLRETIVADDHAWQLRYESLCRLLAHPVMGAAAIDACVNLGSDPLNQVFIETWSALDSAPDPAAGHHLVRQLQQPLNPRAFHGALLGCVRKSEHGHFTPADQAALEGLLHPLANEPSAPAADRYVARAVLRRLDPGSRPPVQARPAPAASVATQAALAHIDRAVRSIDKEEAFGVTVAFDDEMLPRLVQAALSADVDDERLYVSMAVQASPYREVVAGLLAELVGELRGQGQHILLERVVEALRVVGDDRHGPAVAHLIGDSSVPEAVRTSGAFALGHLGARSALDAVPLLTNHLDRCRSGRSPAGTADDLDEELATGVVYSLGVARELSVLRGLQVDGVTTGLRDALRWWSHQPDAVLAPGGS